MESKSRPKSDEEKTTSQALPEGKKGSIGPLLVHLPHDKAAEIDRHICLVWGDTKPSERHCCIGATVKSGDQELFIPRSHGQAPGQTNNAIRRMLDNWDSLEILDGQVFIGVNGIRKRIIELGVFEDASTEPAPADPPTFDIPKSRGRRKRHINAINQSDSFGKEWWRQTWLEMANRAFSGGYESIPENERMVVFFPGVGKEAEMWLQWGFKEEDFIFIEKNKHLSARLRKKYPKAFTIQKHFGRYGHRDEINDAIIGRCIELGSRSNPRQISIINIDPENKLTPNMYYQMRSLFERLGDGSEIRSSRAEEGRYDDCRLPPFPFLGKTCVLGLNFLFTRGRGGKKVLTKVQNLLGENPNHPNFEGRVLENGLREWSGAARSHPNGRVGVRGLEDIAHGNYEGDSAHSRMHFYMHILRQELPQPARYRGVIIEG